MKFWTLDKAAKDICDLVVTNISEETILAKIITPIMIVVFFKLLSFELRVFLLKIFVQIRSKFIQKLEDFVVSKPQIINYFIMLKLSKIFPLWEMNCPIKELGVTSIFVKP